MKWLVVACLLFVPFAGCLDDDGLLTAKGGRNLAADGADEQLDGGELVWVGGIEPFRRYIQDEWTVEIHADSVQADGRAPLWAYVYKNDTHAYGAIVAGALGVLAEAWGPMDDEDMPGVEPITNWTVDSSAVPGILRGELGWPRALENTTTLWSLIAADGTPYWFIEREEANGTDYSAVVNAQNGSIVEGMEYFESEGEMRFAEGYTTISGPVTLVAGGGRGTVQGPGGQSYAELSVDTTGVAGPIRITVTADGDELFNEDAGLITGQGGFGAAFGHPNAREYVLEVYSEGGTAANVDAELTVYWTA